MTCVNCMIVELFEINELVVPLFYPCTEEEE